MPNRLMNLDGTKPIMENWDDLNEGFANAEAELDAVAAVSEGIQAEVTAHKDSTAAHAAEHIAYAGPVAGAGNLKAAVDSVQEQLNTAIVSGDSSPAADQARISSTGTTYPSLKSRLDTERTELSAQLADGAKQSGGYAAVTNRLRRYQNVIFNFMGDSMFYGYDASTGSQATTTVPSRFKEVLNIVYPGNVDVINRGTTGDTTELAYNRWTTSSGADVTIICFGHNDSHYGPGIDTYIEYYRKLIVRELRWGAAVILLESFKQQVDNDVLLDTYRKSIYTLAEEFNLIVIDAQALMAGADATHFSDGWHYSVKGYKYMGTKLAACIIGEGPQRPNRVIDGATLLTRKTLDSCTYLGAVTIADTSQWTPAGECVTLAAGGTVFYSVYLESDSMVCIPCAFLATNSSFVVQVDFNEEQPQYNMQPIITETLDNFPTSTSKPASTITVSTTGTTRYVHPSVSGVPYLTISQSGWHTIAVQQISGTTTFFGLHFRTYANRDTKNRIQMVERNKIGHKLLTLAPSDSSFMLSEAELVQLFYQDAILGGEYFKEKPYKLTIYNWQGCINEYIFAVGNTAGSGGDFCILYKSTQLPNYATNQDIKISSMAKSGDTLTFTLSSEHSNALYGYSVVVSLL